jgi:hypothetical protein
MAGVEETPKELQKNSSGAMRRPPRAARISPPAPPRTPCFARGGRVKGNARTKIFFRCSWGGRGGSCFGPDQLLAERGLLNVAYFVPNLLKSLFGLPKREKSWNRPRGRDSQVSLPYFPLVPDLPLASDPYQPRWYGFRTNGKYRKKELSSSLCSTERTETQKEETSFWFPVKTDQ